MWKMLLERSNGNLKVIFLTVKPMNLWALLYGRLPIYLVKPIKWWSIHCRSQFQFKNGLIIKHDEFDLYKWSKQAFELLFYLDGQDFFKRKFNNRRKNHFKYISKQSKE
jgi:hypothetical protein